MSSSKDAGKRRAKSVERAAGFRSDGGVKDSGVGESRDLPCDDANHWMSVQLLDMTPAPQTTSELAQRMARYLDRLPKLDGLEKALKEEGWQDEFFKTTLPNIIWRAKELERLRDQLPYGLLPLLRQGRRGRLELPRDLGASLLANMFLCTFRDMKEMGHRSMPSSSFLRLLAASKAGQENAKLRMILHFFQRIGRERVKGRISFERVVGVGLQEEEWCQSRQPLMPLRVAPPFVGFETEPHLAHADFANMFIGGGVLGGGCVQEEIRFAICPELILAMLVCPCMLEDEAIQLLGAEQFSKYKGYAFDLRYGGDHVDTSATAQDGSVKSAVLAMDAMDFRGQEITLLGQMSSRSLLRELNKSLAAFSPVSEESLRDHPVLATGNWGGGAFGGCVPLKALLQWASASQCCRQINYFPFDADIGPVLQQISEEATSNGVTVGDLMSAICQIRSEKTDIQPDQLISSVQGMVTVSDTPREEGL